MHRNYQRVLCSHALFFESTLPLPFAEVIPSPYRKFLCSMTS